MACGSGCCAGPSAPPEQAKTEHNSPNPSIVQNSVAVNEHAHQHTPEEVGHTHEHVPENSGCCGDQSATDTCCTPKSVFTPGNTLTEEKPSASDKTLGKQKDACHDGCCSDVSESMKASQPIKNKGCSDGCCSGTSNAKPEAVEVPSRCCPTPDPRPTNLSSQGGCCEQKERSCNGCDVDCLERVALRACEQEKETIAFDDDMSTAVNSRATSTCRGGEDGKPCDRHVRVTRDTYASTMEALGCICRALLALGQESCCVKKERSSVDRRRSRSFKRTSSPALSRKSVDSCGGSTTASLTETISLSGKTRFRHSHKHGGHKATPKSRWGSHCCDSSNHDGGGDVDSCCDGGADSISPADKSTAVTTTVAQNIDLESGLSDAEHIILSVTGMTCSGCETKLFRTLGKVDNIKNLKTSLVLSRAEFDLDLRSGSVQEVIKHLERATEFKCERITNQGSSVDVVPPCPAVNFVKQQWPDGVTDMTVVDKTTVQVNYDPQVVGARDLIDRGWPNPVPLAPPRGDPTLAAGNKHVRHAGYRTLLSIALTIPVLVMAWAPLPERKLEYASASLALATIVQVVIAGPFYPQALKSLIFSRIVEMDLLIVLSTSAAYIFSVVSYGYLVAGKPLSTGEFFETSTLLVTLIMVGRYAAALARQKAVESMSIRSLQVSTALLVDSSGASEKEIDVRLLQYGDIFKVLPDSRVPTDGTVISGSSEVDESMITGESRPVEKYPKSPLIAGTINGSGTILARLTRLPCENTINTIASMVDEAKLTKPRIQDLADHVASYFVPVVVGLATIAFVIWISVGIAVQEKSGTEAAIQAITYAITVLIVSCPCAIGLAVPMVIVVASGVAAERGVIFKSSNSIETGYKTSHVVFDKTGTLTKGQLSVATEVYLDENLDNAASLLLGLVGSIKHPVSVAVATHLRAKGISATSVPHPKSLTGKGVEAKASGRILQAGNSRWLGVSSNSHVAAVLAQGHTAFCFVINGALAAVFGLDDSLRPDAAPTVAKLVSRGVSVHIISGDDEGAVRSVARQLGIPDSNVRPRCAPSDKQAYVQTLLATPVRRKGIFSKREKPQEPVVIFCGDGTNDAVALAQATIGVHMNEGTEVAKSAADVVLMRPSLEGIIRVIDMSKRAVNRIKFNFGWSFVYNIFAILLASGAFVNVRIPPEYAGLGELVSVLPVIAAAVLLKWERT
ncbi:copper-translocating P-type ATPase [Rhypophila sp. PSN 637]